MGVRLYIKDMMALYNCASVTDLTDAIFIGTGFDWIDGQSEPGDYIEVEFPELQIRSALEFLRPELPLTTLQILDKWDVAYKQWISEGIFFERYAKANGPYFTWEDARKDAARDLGRSIPTSHWWYWPPKK